MFYCGFDSKVLNSDLEWVDAVIYYLLIDWKYISKGLTRSLDENECMEINGISKLCITHAN